MRSNPPFLLIRNNRMKYRILQNIETVLTKQEDDVLGSPSTQSRSWSWKFSSGESPPGFSTRLQDLSGVQSGPASWVVSSSSDQQDLDHEYEVLIFYYVNPTVSPSSLIKLEQAWPDRLWFRDGRYSTRPDWLYFATVARAFSGALKSPPPVITKWSPTSIPQAALQCSDSDDNY